MIEKNISFFAWFVLLLSLGCTKDVRSPDYNSYPDEIGKIIFSRCAVSGCHNSTSQSGAAGLDLTSWKSLMQGSRAGSAVIPYQPDYSFFYFSLNSFPELGPSLEPLMPIGTDPLTKEEVRLFRNWILAGAPDKNGHVDWSDQADPAKVYVANQGCDILSVFDLKTKMVKRMIPIGKTPITEAPHDMLVSPDNKYLYVTFYASNLFQKIRCSDDQITGELFLPSYSWHSLSVSNDSKTAVTSSLSGMVAFIDVESMTLKATINLDFPHGSAFSPDSRFVYVVCQQGNFFYKIDVTDLSNPGISQISLNNIEPPTSNGIYKPYEIDFNPGFTKYYVACQGTNEVRVFNASNDSLLAVIPVPGVPQTFGFSRNQPYVFVPCMEDSANHSTISSVAVIDAQTNQLVKAIQSGYQPRGIAVDDEHELVYVANRNISAVGWTPHHTTVCQGRNGYVTFIDMNTLEIVPSFKTELAVDPYSVALKK